MQPQSTHVPPKPSRSTIAAESTSWAQRIAPTYPAGPPPMKITSYEAMSSGRSRVVRKVDAGSVNDHQRVLEHAPQVLQEARAGGTVDHAMIAAHGEACALADDDRAIDDDRFVFDLADGNDAR